MADGKNRRTACVNLVIIVINFMYFGYLEIIGNTEDSLFMAAHGAMFLPAVQEGQYWRLLTAAFMHFGIAHIVNNMLILYVMGDRLERALGSVKYLILYLVSAVGANFVSMLFEMSGTQISVSAGASGAVFGVIGGLLYAVLINRGRLEDLSTRQLTVMLLLSLYFGFTSTGINNVAHVAGLVIGILMGAVLYRRPGKREP